jgi:nickel-dependent lactate racemase
MTAAEASVKEGGVIIMISSCSDGHGGEEFFRQMSLDTADTEKEILSRGRGETLPDQWMTQILIRILNRASVILISEAPDEMIEKMHMIPAHSLEDAMKKAKAVLKNENPTVTAIPDGVAVMVVENK